MSLSAVAVSDQIDSFWVLVEIVRVWCLILTAGCRGHVNKLATEPFVLLHCEHGTGYQQSWNCCERQTSYVAISKHFCFILSTGTRIRTDSVMCPRSSSRGRNTSASVTVTVGRLFYTRNSKWSWSLPAKNHRPTGFLCGWSIVVEFSAGPIVRSCFWPRYIQTTFGNVYVRFILAHTAH